MSSEETKKDNKKKKGQQQQGAAGGDGNAPRPLPDFIRFREDIFDEMYKKQQEELAAKPATPITVTLPDGKTLPVQAWRTSPYDIAKSISEGLAQAAVIAKVNGQLWDMERVLEADCSLEFIKFDQPEGKDTFWHSSAHILGLAMEELYGGSLCYGPPIENGFFYDMEMPGKTVVEADYEKLENIAQRAIKNKLLFQRLVVTREDLLRMFKDNKFKQRLITERITEPATTVYRCGPLIDLCHGPHIRNTSVVKAFWVHKSSSTNWEGKVDAEALQRVYAISFPDKKLLTEYKTMLEEAAKRDHRKLGQEQELFFFHPLSPGSCFFLPRGAFIYKTLQDMMREQYLKRGFQEVITPNIFNKDLWEVSGHWQHYSENMFHFEVEKETFALKPMNCPSHCLMFASRSRSYRELPLRFADFGVLHRNEISGALTGLTRVRRFQQDDAHIFCEPSQIESEIRGCLDFLQEIYAIFGFTFELNLSTRPEKYLGEIEVWDRAEKALSSALDAFGHAWKLNPGDGAFYGPKIDIKVNDALKRAHQCATIQLDFQLPQRFKLEYVPSGGGDAATGEVHRPVIIHRAILGSTERMFAILCEHYAGKWPFWLSPRQCIVIPIAPRNAAYAEEVQRALHLKGFQVDVDTFEGTLLQKKIRNACVAHYNFIFVVGNSEEKHRSVSVRTRDNVQHGEHLLDNMIAHLEQVRRDRRIENDAHGLGAPLPREKGESVGGESTDGASAASEGDTAAAK